MGDHGNAFRIGISDTLTDVYRIPARPRHIAASFGFDNTCNAWGTGALPGHIVMTIDAHQSARGFAKRISEETLPPFCLVPETNAYWSARPKQHFLPGRKDIDPVDLGAKLLARLFLTDVLNADAGMDSRFQLAGTSNARLISIEPRGRLASDIFATGGRSFMMAGYRDTIAGRAARFWYDRTSGARRFGFHGLLALASDGTHVDMLISITEPAVMQTIEERALAVGAHAI